MKVSRGSTLKSHQDEKGLLMDIHYRDAGVQQDHKRCCRACEKETTELLPSLGSRGETREDIRRSNSCAVGAADPR